MLALFRRRRRRADAAKTLYARLVGQARAPALFVDFRVPDSLDGRFDLVVLHAHLLFRRLKATGREGVKLGQAVFDVLFADMDDALRELGVSDLSVARKVRDMTSAFYGRAAAYEGALAPGAADDALREVLRRNVYRGTRPTAEAIDGLAGYVRAVDAALARHDLSALYAADLALPDAADSIADEAWGQDED